MPQLRKATGRKGKRTRNRVQREFVFTASERQLLKKIGLRIHKDLFDQSKPTEWLAFKVGLARSTIHEIIAGRSNPRVLTLHSIAQGLGHSNLVDFLRSAF